MSENASWSVFEQLIFQISNFICYHSCLCFWLNWEELFISCPEQMFLIMFTGSWSTPSQTVGTKLCWLFPKLWFIVCWICSITGWYVYMCVPYTEKKKNTASLCLLHAGYVISADMVRYELKILCLYILKKKKKKDNVFH